MSLDLWIKNSRGFIVPTIIYAKMHMDSVVGACFVAVFWWEKIVKPFTDNEKYGADEVFTMMAEKNGAILDISPAFNRLFLREYDGPTLAKLIAEIGWTWKCMDIEEPGEVISHLNFPREGSYTSLYNEEEINKRYKIKMVPFKTTQGLIDVLLFTMAPVREPLDQIVLISDTTELKEFGLESEDASVIDHLPGENSSINPPSSTDIYTQGFSMMEMNL